MTDITSIRLIYLKASLFLIAGFIAAGTLLTQHPELEIAFLLLVSIWCFARFYYFAFYVIEHYVDDQYHFAGFRIVRRVSLVTTGQATLMECRSRTRSPAEVTRNKPVS